MKVGIITFNFAQNWGAVLQGYALQRFIQQKLSAENHDVKLIYWEQENNSLFMPVKTVKNGIHSLLHIGQCYNRVKRFHEFRVTMSPFTEPCFDSEKLKALNDSFDCFITGSDQVWSVSDNMKQCLFLDFVGDQKKKISYAASFGATQIDKKYEEVIAPLIERLDYVSVREDSGKKIISRFSNRDVSVCLDPVFLLSKSEWSEVAGAMPVISGKYVFVYPTQITKEFCALIKAAKKAMPDLQFISLYYVPGCRTLKSVGPREFVNLIMNAQYVIATSFHATAFSIIFNKNFCVVPHSTTGSRMIDLCKLIGLDDAVISPGCENVRFCSLNYSKSNQKLVERISASEQYLREALKEDESE